MSDVFILFDTSADSFVVDVQEKDAFRMWQGLAGPYYTPSVDEAGNLSWTNNGGLVNPETVNIQGRGLNIIGIVDDVSGLPESATENDVYMVGMAAPYEGYIYTGGSWVDIGVIGRGAQGQTGPGVAAGGTAGQVLKKRSSTDYDTEWSDSSQPATNVPIVDGTAAVGTSAKYAREDHVHPTDTSRVAKSGDTMTGTLNAPVIATGSDAANYFQTRKMRGEGDADSYYHAIDFGYSGNNKVDFYEYGGEWNFYRSDETPAALVGQIHKTFGWRGKVAGHNVSDFVTKKASVSLTTSSPAWAETSPGSGIYVEDVTVETGTEYTKVDLQPTAAQILQLISDGVQALFIENNSSMFTAYAIGAAPTTAMTIQATLTEVEE